LRDTTRPSAADITALAYNESISERNIRRALPLAFLAPDIVKAAIDGELPPDLVMTRIQSDLLISWSDQRAALGLV
jgi:site-specific DNA recombinase